MEDFEDMEYDEDECVKVIEDYYAFLTAMYLDPAKVRYPPEGGWPEITSEVFEGLNKIDTVISLLRRLPYIDSGDDETQLAARAAAADWASVATSLINQRFDAEKLRIITEGSEASQTDCRHVIGLTQGGSDTELFLLDTEQACIFWLECPGEVEIEASQAAIGDDPEEYAPEDEIEWRREATAWEISDFFELLKDRFRALKMVPISEIDVADTLAHTGEDRKKLVSRVQEIYREHGWPDEAKYRKDECLAAIERAKAEMQPDLYS